MNEIRPVLQSRKGVILDRIGEHGPALRETFAALEVLEYRRTFDECVELAEKALG